MILGMFFETPTSSESSQNAARQAHAASEIGGTHDYLNIANAKEPGNQYEEAKIKSSSNRSWKPRQS